MSVGITKMNMFAIFQVENTLDLSQRPIAARILAGQVACGGSVLAVGASQMVDGADVLSVEADTIVRDVPATAAQLGGRTLVELAMTALVLVGRVARVGHWHDRLVDTNVGAALANPLVVVAGALRGIKPLIATKLVGAALDGRGGGDVGEEAQGDDGGGEEAHGDEDWRGFC